MHLFTLKINSEYNIIILFLITALNFFTDGFFLKLTVNILTLFFLETLNNPPKTNFFFNNWTFNELNPNLTNSLLVAHPIFLYYICACILASFYNNFFFKKFSFLFRLSNKFNITPLLKIVLSLIISIFLGSFWAEQELNWGGWWTWDLIEVISLSYLIYFIIFFHITIKLRTHSLIYVNILINFLLFTLLVKFNFISSIHNFTTLNTSFQFFFEIFIFFSGAGLCLVIFKFFKNKNYLFKQSVNILSYLLLLLGVWSYFYLIIDFLFIFNDRSSSLEIFFKNHKTAIIIISIFFIIFYEGFVWINTFYLTFIEYFLNFLIRSKLVKPDFLHFSFFSFFLLTNLTYFFPDPISFNTNLLEYFYMSNSNFFNHYCLTYTTKNLYSEDALFNNSNIFFKNIIFFEQVLLELFSSNNKFFLNLNLFLLLKISIFIQSCIYYNYTNKNFFLY